MNTKVCCACRKIKPVTSFFIERRKKDGRTSRCKLCRASYLDDLMGRMSPTERKVFDARRKGIIQRMGLSVQDYISVLEGRPCDICGETTGIMHRDHDHTTGKFRGVLCSRCNPALGLFRDNKVLVAKALVYLRKHTK